MWERYRALVERSADVIVLIDGHGDRPVRERDRRDAASANRRRIWSARTHSTSSTPTTGAGQSSRSTVPSRAVPGPQDPFFARVRLPDGSWMPAEIVGNNLTGDPAVEHHVVIIRDVTDRDRLDRLMVDTEATYRRIVETAEEGVLQVDNDLRTTFVNRRMAEMLGWDRARHGRAQGLRLHGRRPSGIKVRDIVRRGTSTRARSATRSASRTATATTCGPGAARRRSRAPTVDLDGAVALVTEITEQRTIEEQLRYNETRLTTLFEVSSDIMAILEPDGTWHASPAGTRILGYPIGWDPEGGIMSLVHPDDLDDAGGGARARSWPARRGKHEPARLRLRHIDGRYLWFDCTAENQIDNPTVRGLIIIARDVTDQKAAEDAQAEAEARFRAAFEGSPLGIVLSDLEGGIIDANAAFCRMAGRHEDELIGVRMADLIHPEDRDRVHRRGHDPSARPERRPSEPGPAPAARRPDRVDDERRLARPYPDGEPEYTIVQTADVTERKKLEERLEHQAFHDPLTGIGNRAQLAQAARHRLVRARDDPGRLALPVRRPRPVQDDQRHLRPRGRRRDPPARRAPARAQRPRRRLTSPASAVTSSWSSARRSPGREEALQIAGRIRESLALTYRLSIGEAKVHASVGIAIDDGPDLPSTTCCATPTSRRTKPRSSVGTGCSSRTASWPSPSPAPSPASPRTRQQVTADDEAAVERLARHLLAVADAQQRDPLMGDHTQARLGRVGGRRVGVDRGHLEREVGAADRGEVGGEHEEVGAFGSGGSAQVKLSGRKNSSGGSSSPSRAMTASSKPRSTRGSTSSERYRSSGPSQPSSGWRSTSQFWRSE